MIRKINSFNKQKTTTHEPLKDGFNVLTLDEYNTNLFERFTKIANDFNKENIPYWIHSGTLLGFIRDSKIIPWDDDIDIAIKYIDFVKYEKKINEICKKHGFYLRSKFDKKNTLDISKIMSNEVMYVLYDGGYYKTRYNIDLMYTLPVRKNSKFIYLYWSYVNALYLVYKNWFGVYHKKFIKKQKLMKVSYWYTFPTFIVKFIIPKPVVRLFLNKYIYKRSLKKSEINWSNHSICFILSNKLRYQYNNEFKFLNVEGNKFRVNKNYKEELDYWFGKNWNDSSKLDESKKIPYHLITNCDQD